MVGFKIIRIALNGFFCVLPDCIGSGNLFFTSFDNGHPGHGKSHCNIGVTIIGIKMISGLGIGPAGFEVVDFFSLVGLPAADAAA